MGKAKRSELQSDFQRVLDELAELVVVRDEQVAELERNLNIAADALEPLLEKPGREVVTLSGIALLAVQGAAAAVVEIKSISIKARDLRGKGHEQRNH